MCSHKIDNIDIGDYVFYERGAYRVTGAIGSNSLVLDGLKASVHADDVILIAKAGRPLTSAEHAAAIAHAELRSLSRATHAALVDCRLIDAGDLRVEGCHEESIVAVAWANQLSPADTARQIATRRNLAAHVKYAKGIR